MRDHQDVPEVKSITVATPVAGAEFSLSAPGQGLWRVLGLRATFVASAAVATRVATLAVATSDGVVSELGAISSVTAGLTRRYSGFNGSGPTLGLGGAHQWAWPTDGVLLLPGFTLSSSTEAIDVADQWSLVRALVVEYPTGPQWRLTPDVANYFEPRV